MRNLLRRSAYTLATLLLTLFALVQLQQRLLRHRAEQLHADILALQLHPGTFTDLQRLQTRWGSHASYHGECTPHHCNYEIGLEDALTGFFSRHEHFPPLWAMQALSHIGARDTFAFAEVRIHDNRMWGADFGLTTSVVPQQSLGEDYLYALSASIDYGPHLDSRNDYSAAALRRGYGIGKPDACTGCVTGWVHLTPAASEADIRRLNDIQFACITTWRECIDQQDIMPGAWKQYGQSSQDDLSRKRDHQDCSPVQQLAQEAENIALITVLPTTSADRERAGPASDIATLRIDTLLKNGQTTAPGSTWLLGQEKAYPDSVTPSQPPIFTPETVGHQFLLLYQAYTPWPQYRYLEPDRCSTFLPTEQNRAAVQQGIALDTSAGEPYRHDTSFP